MLLMKWLTHKKIITGGTSKKAYVMNKLKEYMDKEDYERYEPAPKL